MDQFLFPATLLGLEIGRDQWCTCFQKQLEDTLVLSLIWSKIFKRLIKNVI